MSQAIPHSASAVPLVLGIPPEPVVTISVAAYDEMIRTGVIQEDDPVELLDGFLVLKMTTYPPHEAAVRRLRRKLEALLSDRWLVDPEMCVGLATSVPEPDVIVYRGAIGDYDARRPGPADIALLVEVADSTLSRDRNWKRRIYARAGIPIYWIANLNDRTLEVYSGLHGEGEAADYQPAVVLPETCQVTVTLDGVSYGDLYVAELLPKKLS